MNKNNGRISGAGHPTGSPPSLAKELGGLVENICQRKYITNKVLDLLKKWQAIMTEIFEKKDVEISIDGEKVGFKYFDDWIGTTQISRYLFHMNEKILPRSREEIGSEYCNTSNLLSRTWIYMNYEELKWLLAKLNEITEYLLLEFWNFLPTDHDVERIERLIKKLEEVK